MLFYLFFLFFLATFLLLVSRNTNRLFGFFLFGLVFFLVLSCGFFFHKAALHFQYLQTVTSLDF